MCTYVCLYTERTYTYVEKEIKKISLMSIVGFNFLTVSVCVCLTGEPGSGVGERGVGWVF